MVRHMLNLKDYSRGEILQILEDALEIKANREKYSDLLKGKNLLQIYQKTSTRTIVSFAFAMMELGGNHFYISYEMTNFSIVDEEMEADCASRYVDIIVARYKKHKDLQILAKGSQVPVINGCDEKYHPCQALGDLLTMKEKFGNLENLKVIYVGIANNISNPLSLAATKVGISFVLCSPERDPGSLDDSLMRQVESSRNYSEEPDIKKAVKDADVIYTDTWINMEVFSDPKFEKEKERRIEKFMPYQINSEILKLAPNALVMHNMPLHPGFEISKEVAYSKNSIIMDQAENRKHVQKAVLPFLLNIKVKK